jgi:hypothetical protein
MPVRPPGPFPLNETMTETWMVRFDKQGRCLSPRTRDALLEQLTRGPKADVIYFSHGWKTDFDGAEGLYRAYLKSLMSLTGADELPDRRFVFVGVTWPSQWIPGTQGPVMAVGAEDTEMLDTLVDMTSGLSADDAERVYALVHEPILDDGQALDLLSLLVKSAPHAGAETADVVEDQGPADAQTLLEAWRRLSPAAAETDFDAVGVATGENAAAAAGGGLDPLDAVRLFSLYQMKDRAGVVGAGGVADLLTGIVGRARAVYAVGHSFGAKVMLSAVKCATLDGGALVKLLLLQPALSHLAFAAQLPNGGRAGYADVPARVARIFTTFSYNDWPLHGIFHLALLRPSDVGELDALAAAAELPPNRFAALGGYGPAGIEHDALTLEVSADTYAGAVKKVVALNGTGSIGDHNDVANLACAAALRRLID